jgi:hypothetical protein
MKMMTQELEDVFREIVNNDVETGAFTAVAEAVIALVEFRDTRDVVLYHIARALEKVRARQSQFSK